jgi:cytochrome-b5 reductase
MAMAMRRAGRASSFLTSSLPRGEISSTIFRRYNTASATAAAQKEDEQSSPTRHAWTALSALVGAAAVYASSQQALSTNVALAEECKDTQKSALNPNEWVKFKLQETHAVNHNTKLFRFKFDSEEALGLHVASCLLTKAAIGTKKDGSPNIVIRPYTPISPPDSKGYFDLLIKVYPEGRMSQHIAHLQPGDTLEVKGPIPKLPYKRNMKKEIGMIAGGTGITPMLQVIDAIISDPEDNTQISLVFANVTPEDILLKEKLDAISFAHPNFKVFYVCDRPSKDWKGGRGHINKDVLLKALPSPCNDSLILVCGPPGLMNFISGDKAPDKSQGPLVGLLKELGYSADQVFKF